MTRGEATALGAALVGHVILFGLLSVGFLSTPNPKQLVSKPIDVSLVDDIAMQSAAPASVTPPAQAIAPELGKPSDAPAPADTSNPDMLNQPDSQPKPSPAPKPADVAQPKPKPKAEPEKPASKPAPSSRTASRPSPKPDRSQGRDAKKPERPTAPNLGADFAKGVLDQPSKGKSQTPRAERISAQALASLGDAIRRQVQPCASRTSSPGPGANQISTKIRIQMNPDGSLAARPELRGQSGVTSENQRYSRRVAEMAMSAFIACAPYHLPDELYEGGWKDIILNYNLPG